MDFVRLSLPPDAGLVGVARAMAVAAATSAELDDVRIQDVRTCVSEAMTNAVHAHLAAGLDAPITVSAGYDDHQFVVEVHDRGTGLPASIGLPEAFPASDADVDDLAEGGYGIPVMHALADSVDLQQTPEPTAGTLVRLHFLLQDPMDV